MSDEKYLIEGCKEGKEPSQKALYKKYARKMMGVCIRYLKKREEAEDAFQEAFIKVFSNISSFQGDNIEAWMKRIFINKCIDNYHKNKRYQDHIEYEDAPDIHLKINDIISQISNNELLKIINNLPEGYRLVFNLNIIEGYTHKEITELLGISEGTSKSQLSKAKKSLQKELKRLYPKEYERR